MTQVGIEAIAVENSNVTCNSIVIYQRWLTIALLTVRLLTAGCIKSWLTILLADLNAAKAQIPSSVTPKLKGGWGQACFLSDSMLLFDTSGINIPATITV